MLFYTLLNKHAAKFKNFVESNPQDAESTLYAVKPGFISKSPEVAQLTITLFKNLKKNVYEWFVGESRGASTMLLGIKRHPHFRYEIWDLMSDIAKDNDI